MAALKRTAQAAPDAEKRRLFASHSTDIELLVDLRQIIKKRAEVAFCFAFYNIPRGTLCFSRSYFLLPPLDFFNQCLVRSSKHARSFESCTWESSRFERSSNRALSSSCPISFIDRRNLLRNDDAGTRRRIPKWGGSGRKVSPNYPRASRSPKPSWSATGRDSFNICWPRSCSALPVCVSDANYEKRFVAGAVPNRRVNRVALLWQVADGLITLVLGLFVLAEWPVSGLWVIGLFVGIDLIFYGCAWIGLALNLRTM